MVTRLGLAMIAVAAAACGGAWLLGYPELAVLGSAAALAVVSALAWVRPVPRLHVQREIAPAKVARGDPAIGMLTITNSGRGTRPGLPGTRALTAAALRAADSCAGEPVSVRLPPLAPGKATTVGYRLPTGRRGAVVVGPLRVERSDPFGLARRVREFGGRRTLLVRPRTVALPIPPSGRDHHLEGPISDTAPAGAVTFRALRDYVPGDDLRHVHWKSSARTGALMVRQLVDASLPQTTVVVDLRAGRYGAARLELALDAAASVAVAAAGRGFPVQVLAGARCAVRSTGGRDAADAILDALALAEPARDGEETFAIDAIRAVRAGGSLVAVAGELTAAELGALGSARRRFHRVVLVRICPGPGAAAPDPAPPGVTAMDIADLRELAALWPRQAAR